MLNYQGFNKKLLAACFITLGLTACSSTDDENDELKVAELTEINQQFDAETKWDSSVGDGVGEYFSRIKPTVAYGKVFSTSRNGDTVAFDVTTGERLWQIDLSDINKQRGFFDDKLSALVSGGPVAGINKVFIGTENGDVFALEAETGALVWQGEIKGEVIAAPALDSGKLVVNSASGILKAFNASNGDEDWQVEREVPALTLRGISEPAIAAGGVLVGSANGSITVFLLEKGQQGWTAEIGEATGSSELERVVDVDSTPLIYGDTVYSISARGNLSAIELRTGRILWERQYSSYRSIAIDGNTLFITDIKGHVYAIDRNDGLELWTQAALTNRNVTGPAPVGDYVVVGDFEGYLHWLDQNTGEIVSRYHVDGSGLYATPTVADGVIYVQARDGDIAAIESVSQ